MNQEEQLCPNDLVLLHLGRRLLADGYRFTTPTPLTHQRVNQRDEGQMADSLRDVFGWSRPFAPGLLSADEQRQLQDAQVIDNYEGHLKSRVRWSSLDDLLFVHSAFPTVAADAVFFGPDTYRFAQLIHAHLQQNFAPIKRAVDIGCGAGVGAILIGRARREAQVLALDINPAALRLTTINAALAEVANVEACNSDILQGVDGDFDLIVANPPYIAQGDPHLPALAHEPPTALVSGPKGLDDLQTIATQAMAHLKPGAWLLLEHGYDQAQAVCALLRGQGYGQVQSRNDLAGIERCTGGQWRTVK